MQKLLFVAMMVIVIALVACNSDKKTETAAATETPVEKPNYAYTPEYSSSFEMGKPKYSETVLKLWKDYDNGNFSSSKDLFADSVEMYFRDGTSMHNVRDSIVGGAQEFRNGFSKVESRVSAFFPVRATDKNEDWVCVWGTEVSTTRQGKIDSVYLHEIWRFNKDGKVDFMSQYAQTAKPAK
jgi:hypothetical protein